VQKLKHTREAAARLAPERDHLSQEHLQLIA
jgi:hypothetical protein